MTKRLIGAYIGLFAILSQATALGHMRWFVDQHAHFPEKHYSADLTSALVLLGGIGFGLFSWWVHRSCSALNIRKQLEQAAPVIEPVMWRLVAALAGLMLIINSGMKIYLAPNLSLTGAGATWFGLTAQGLVGALLLFQISFSISGLLIYVAAALALFYNAPELMIDYVFEFAALGLSLILVGPQLSSLDRRVFSVLKFDSRRYGHLPIPIIRVGVGITLIVLAIHNKFLNPSMSVAFLEEYDLNFMPYFGFSGFSNLHYAFSAGVAELVIGVLVMLGIATRFVISVLAVFFVCTLIVLAPMELIGHLPLFGIAFLLIACGGGRLRRN